MTFTLLIRIIDNLFRHPVRYALPVTLFAAIGFLSLSTADEFESTGVVFVDESSVIADLTEVSADGFSFLSAAEAAQEQLFGLMQTDSFMNDVLDEAGSAGEAPRDPVVVDAARQAISTSVSSGSFLDVSATTTSPGSAQALATATLDAYIGWLIEADLTETLAAEEFLAQQVALELDELQRARAAVDDFLVLNPDPLVGDRSTQETIDLTILSDSVTAAQAKYDQAVQALESAELLTSQAEINVRSAFRVEDAPKLPTEPLSSIFDTALRVALFAIMGMAMSAAALLISTVVDTSVRFPIEVRERLGTEVLALVPRAK